MVWARLDDDWADQVAFEHLAINSRWHYLAMILVCCRTKRFDGRLPRKDALRASDVDDPLSAIVELSAAGLVVTEPDGGFRLPQVPGDHAPSKAHQLESERSAVRMRRSRAHKVGDHSTCLPKYCGDAPQVPGDHAVTESVARNDALPERDAIDVARNTGTERLRYGSGTTQLQEPRQGEPVECVTCGAVSGVALLAGRCRSCHFGNRRAG